MQYLLTSEELSNLVDKEEVAQRERTITLLREALLKESKYICCHDKMAPKYQRCDDCPMIKLAMNYQKVRFRDLCSLEKNFSK